MSVLLLLAPLLIVVWPFYLARKHLWLLLGGRFSSSPNPFQKPARKRKGAPLTIDHKERDKVLKQSFSVDKIPNQLDAIVIGSGIGGLGVAAILAKLGKKVLVLEQHDQAGGCCHTFVEKGYEFDVGIHYIGEMAEGKLTRVLIDQLTESGIEWARLDDVYDTVILAMNEERKEERKKRTFSIHSGRKELIASLKKDFPSEEKAITKYFSILKEIRTSTTGVGLLKLLPLSLSCWLVSSGLFRWMFPVFKYYTRSVSDVLSELTNNKDLKAVLSYSFGDYGTIPKEASFAMQALLTNHFTYGAYYPVGGSSEIAFNLIPTIEATGGRVLVRAQVTNILMDNNHQRAVGVSVSQGHLHYDIMAPCIISDAGIMNTFKTLLPSAAVKRFGIKKSLLSRVRHGLPLMSVFVGLDGTKEELGLRPSNIWAFQDENFDETMDEYLKTKPEDVGCKCPPLMFVSFPSTKDPAYNQRFPGKSTCAIVTAVSYEWFERWKDEPALRRGSDYEDYKKNIGKMLWERVVQMFPQLEGHVEYFDVGSPLTNTFYLATLKGEVYGADHDTVRFSLDAMTRMRPDVGIPGLYLTGQDVLTCGFSGALYGSLFCAMTIAKRNLLADLTKLTKQIQKIQKAKKVD